MVLVQDAWGGKGKSKEKGKKADRARSPRTPPQDRTGSAEEPGKEKVESTILDDSGQEEPGSGPSAAARSPDPCSPANGEDLAALGGPPAKKAKVAVFSSIWKASQDQGEMSWQRFSFAPISFT